MKKKHTKDKLNLPDINTIKALSEDDFKKLLEEVKKKKYKGVDSMLKKD